MATAKNTASEGTPKLSADILRKLDELSVGISKVRGTARCVQLALFHQLSHGDREISILVREHIVHELNRLKKQTESIMIALAGRLPFSEREELDDLVE